MVLLAVSAAKAQASVRPPDTAQTTAEVTEFPLERLMSRSESVMLKSSADQYAFYIPLSPRARLQQATLTLVYTNSISLVESRSQLRVRLNGKVLAQAPLKPTQPEGVLRVNLPPELLEPGYNELAFHVAQHYVEQCEDPTAAELWTQIDTTASRLRLVHTQRAVSHRLSALKKMVDPLGWDPYRVTILTADSMLGEGELATGTVVSQALAGMLRYRPLKVAHGTARTTLLEPDEVPVGRVALLDNSLHGDAVLLGTAEELGAYLPPRIAAEIDGPYIGVTHHVADSSRMVLVVSGRNQDEIASAATALALSANALPDAPSMTVRQLELPQLPRYAHANAISAAQRYAFSAFGQQTVTMGSSGPDRTEFDLWVPPDLFMPADSTLELHLHMAYGAGADPTSVVNVELNGRFASAIRMVSPDGGVFRDYVIYIPAGWLQPGRNTVRFRTYMMPASEGDVCFTPSDKALLVSLFDDSWLMLSDARHHVELPDLRLFALTGFPNSTPVDGGESHLRVVGRDGDTAGAAWTIAGKLTQLTGVPPWRTTVGPGPAEDGRHEIVVGAIDALPGDRRNAAPVAFGPNGLIKPEVLSMPEGTPDAASVRNFFRAGRGLAEQQAPVLALAAVGYSAQADGRSFLLQFESPAEPGTLISLLTAQTPQALRMGTDRLVEHDMWGSLAGDIAGWRPAAESAATGRVGNRFHIGQRDLRSWASFYFSSHPLVWTALLGLAMLSFVVTSVYLLRRRAARRHA
jgi:hypothetical protein